MTPEMLTFAAYAGSIASGAALPSHMLSATGSDPSPYEVLRRLVPRDELRELGTFFTSSAMATELWGTALASIADDAVIVDPACGAGDLLLPALTRANAYKLRNVVIRACDVDPHFTRIAAPRLLAADVKSICAVEAFTRDFLEDCSTLSDATHVVMNPPFIRTDSVESWGKGTVNLAARFITKALAVMSRGSRLLALLPDVLRSGSRYETWREEVASSSTVAAVKPLGVFDEQTDVHVFRLEVIVGTSERSAPWLPTHDSLENVGSHCNVRVGPVVPHRDPEEGRLVDFLTARSLSAGTSNRRRFRGRLEQGPMVLVNRTSRPGESPRVRARLWTNSKPVAVENHLLVLTPTDGRLETCHELLNVLKHPSTARFLDERIRCRHLTVRAIKEIPWMR